jgi:thiosulfate/3-mercaptopyruvate sulfurtransferase
MQLQSAAVVLGTALLMACNQYTPPDESEPESAATPAGAASAELDLFVDAPATGSQLVFVGQDSAVRPAGRSDAVFVPLSTFSIERDGIPNEFPRADSMAALLAAAGVRGDRVVIVGAPIPAGRAYAAFDYLGHGDRAALLDGGTSALSAAGAADGSTAPAAPANGGSHSALGTSPRTDMIVDAAWVHERLADARVAILDARPPAEFSGATPGDGIDRPGHIPGARNVFWQTLVQSADNPRLKEEAELRRIFEQAGVSPGDTIVAYCRTGGQASFLYTVARHLGYDVRLYDGSFIDWSRTDYPVER